MGARLRPRTPSFLSRARLGFGILSWQDLGVYLIVGIGGVFALLAAFTLRRRHVVRSKVERAYARFCRRLARIGIERALTEGPLDFAHRAQATRPDLAPRIEAITRLYVALRYGHRPKPEWARELQHAVTTFKV